MKKMRLIIIKLVVISTLSLGVSGCSSPMVQYSKSQKIVYLKINDTIRKDLKLNQPEYGSYYDQCIDFHFVLKDNLPKYGEIFMEDIAINNKCTWMGLAEWYFVDYMKKYFNATSIELIYSYDIDNYKFSKYLLNNCQEVTMIELWNSSENIFIFDKKGIYSQEIVNSLLSEGFVKNNINNNKLGIKKGSTCSLSSNLNQISIFSNIQENMLTREVEY